MWELYTTINGARGEKQEFSDFKEGKKAFRKAVKQAFDENPELLEHFIAQIDAYCDKYFPVKKRAKKPVPSSFEQLKNVLRNYATNAAYNVKPNVFFVSNYRDKNIEIHWADLYRCDRTISLWTKITKKKKGKPLMFPNIYIPLRFEDDEFGNSFLITDNPDGSNSLLPNTFSIRVQLDPIVYQDPEDNAEYFDEDDYDDDDNYDEDDDEEYSPPVRSSSYTRSSAASELRKAEKAYSDAVYNHKRFIGHSMETHYEIQEKKAYAALLSAQAKYDACK